MGSPAQPFCAESACFPCAVWVLSVYFGFCQQSEDMHVSLTSDSNSTVACFYMYMSSCIIVCIPTQGEMQSKVIKHCMWLVAGDIVGLSIFL